MPGEVGAAAWRCWEKRGTEDCWLRQGLARCLPILLPEPLAVGLGPFNWVLDKGMRKSDCGQHDVPHPRNSDVSHGKGVKAGSKRPISWT